MSIDTRKRKMKSMFKRVVFPTLTGVALLIGSSVQGQLAGDISRIYSENANDTFYSAGSVVDLRIKLREVATTNLFTIQYLGGLSEATAWVVSPLMLRVQTGGGVAYAKLTGLNNHVGSRTTEFVFEYTVRPGDLALPMLIYGNAGSLNPGDDFQFINNQWRIYNPARPSDDVIWKYLSDNSFWEGAADPNFVKQNVRIQTIDFLASEASYSVQKTKTVIGTVTSGSPVTNDVTFYMWVGDTNIAQVTEQLPSNPSAAFKLLSGQANANFHLRGIAENSDTYVYLSPNPTPSATLTNWVRRQVFVTDPPSPTVSVTAPGMDGTGSATFDESDTPNIPITVSHSDESWLTPVVVRLDLPSGQTSLAFDVSPKYVTLLPGTRSATVSLAAKDGTPITAIQGINITPVLTNAAANTHFSIKEPLNVKVRNIAPVLIKPVVGATVPANSLIAKNFDWEVSDVAADLSTNMVVTWVWGDGTADTIVTGAVGTVAHTFSTPNNYTVTATARDKDGKDSLPVSFFVNVTPAEPIPYIAVTPSAPRYSESNETGSVSFRLFTPGGGTFPDDVWVKLEVEYPDPAVTNIHFGTLGPIPIIQGETNSSELVFQITDGTLESALTGINLRPVVVSNATAVGYFTSLRTTNIKVDNRAPQINAINGQNLTVVSNLVVKVPALLETTFSAQIRDVNADLGTAQIFFDFGDGSPVVSNSVVQTSSGYARGEVKHTFSDVGIRDVVSGRDYFVDSWTEDKDGGISDRTSFIVRVGPPPMVKILSPVGSLSEEFRSDGNDTIIVQLSSAFTQAVTVALSVSPGNSPTAGYLELETYSVVFPPGNIGEMREATVKISNVRDGTSFSSIYGFTITPTIAATPEAQAFYSVFPESLGRVFIVNAPPDIKTPSDVPRESQANSYTVAQGADYTFNWNVEDVVGDWTNSLTGNQRMRVTWTWADGAPDVGYGRVGSITHKFDAVGRVYVEVVAEDKDGGRDKVGFYVLVLPAKKVNVIPVGPVISGAYAGAKGLGNGLIYSDEARTRIIEQDVYSYSYDPTALSSTLRAVPYKANDGTYTLTNYTDRVSGLPGVYPAYGKPGNVSNLDSFFYTWQASDDAGLAESAKMPLAHATQVITLPQVSTTGDGAQAEGGDVKIGQYDAIFSREYRPLDNRGDINADGIPDIISVRYKLHEVLGDDLTSATAFNKDLDADGQEVGDFLPAAAGISGSEMIPSVSNSYAAVGLPFTAFLETRGFHEGLNDFDVGRDPIDKGPTDGPLDEPGASLARGGGTDPTRVDTDGDGYPDGWEYYFWYYGQILELTGVRYNPQDVAQGIEIPTKTIVQAFDPLVPANDINRDLDGDGLADLEELAIGTNPIHWDTDGDGMCDGWEVLMGLNPNVRDGTANPDGDYMAYATTDRQFVTLVNGSGETNTFLAVGAAVGEASGTFSTWWRYGDTNAPITLGRSVAAESVFANDAQVVAAENIEVLLVHNQVYQEFGFDPRTAWGSSVNDEEFPNRFPGWIAKPVNTRAFTSRDEYLVLKYMSEMRLNGAGAAMPVSLWSSYSTHPKTPDTDVVWNDRNEVVKTDRMPDGWELYVSSPRGDIQNFFISPWDAYDGDRDYDPDDGENLINAREFHGTICSTFYTNTVLYSMTAERKDKVTILRPSADLGWVNKYWPTDPFNPDTDGDGLNDLAESQYFRDDGVATNTVCAIGGGLNPNAMDTDLDGLPDAWEVQFRTTETPVGALAVTNGMDGTVSDALEDWDSDGLLNYQEYYVQALRHLRYDITEDDLTDEESLTELNIKGVTMGMDYNPISLFTEVANGVREGQEGWDISRYPWGRNNPVLHVLLPVGNSKLYVSTDPRDADTDGDGMDDFYELFHGLNPILGDPVLTKGDRIAQAYRKQGSYTITYFYNDWWPDILNPIPMDFVSYPWLTGLDEADPDGDGLRNFEEQIQADTGAPNCTNTDPSPLWLTDYSSADSVTARFYQPFLVGMFGPVEPVMWFWPGTTRPDASFYMYSFEMNEGYDTDNDGVSDKDELLTTTNTNSDPQDQDDPIRRQAIWFSGENSVAQNLVTQKPNDENMLRTFTVEFWFNPERLDVEQVMVERLVEYGPSDLSTPDDVVRANFRVGIDELGCVYGMFQNAGVHDVAIVKSLPGLLQLGEWAHVALRMDGEMLELFLNGKRESSTGTQLVPANGVININQEPGSQQYPEAYRLTYSQAMLVLGGSNLDPFPEPNLPSWGDFEKFYQGYIDELRIWDGARSDLKINENYATRYTRARLIANRRQVAEARFAGGKRIAGYPISLPAELLYHYTFDNIFSADRAEVVGQVPRGFNHADVVVNRPDGYEVGWWAAHPLASEVYQDRGYVPWIENSIDHLPLDGFTDTTYRESFMVANSKYWGNYAAGAGTTNLVPRAHDMERFEFPNSGNPYGLWYETSNAVDRARLYGAADLLPLGDAFAKQIEVMWDVDAPSSVWPETGEDTDSDGLPDWWEVLHGLDPNSAAGMDGWYGDVDGSGISNGEKYLRDIAHGWRQGDTLAGGPTGMKQTADTDQDGLPDWWENLYGLRIETDLDSEAATASEDGALGDPDDDGLNNLAEYLISEVYTNFGVRLHPRRFKTTVGEHISDYFLRPAPGKVYFGELFTDHDFMEFNWERLYSQEYVNPFVYDAHLDPDQDGWSNWSEARYGATVERSDPTMIDRLNAQGEVIKEYPVPLIEAQITYHGVQPYGALIVHAFSDPEMNGLPDAIFTVPSAVGDSSVGQPRTRYLGFWGTRSLRGALSPGGVVPGTVDFAFTDATPLHLPVEGTIWSVGNRTVAGVITDRENPESVGKIGDLVARNAANNYTTVGWIDYQTGAFELSLDEMEGWALRPPEYDEYGVLLLPGLDVNDAVINVNYRTKLIPSWPRSLYFADADPHDEEHPCLGHIKEGKNYFFAFLDLNEDGVWSAGEPCATDSAQGVDIGFDRNTVCFELTDYTPGILRATLDGTRSDDVYFGVASDKSGSGGTGGESAGLEQRVRVRRTFVQGMFSHQAFVLDKWIRFSRNAVHEGDLLAANQLALDWGFTDVPSQVMSTLEFVVYDMYVGDDAQLTNNLKVASFTNNFTLARAKAVSVAPANGGYVYAARPTFQWRMPNGLNENNYPGFVVQVRRSGETAPIYTSDVFKAPPRDIDGNYSWQAPIYANSRLPGGNIFDSNRVYEWRVLALNAKFHSQPTSYANGADWSDWVKFRVDVNQERGSNAGYGTILARIKYFGPATSMLNARVRLQAFDNAGFAGVPLAEYTLTAGDLASLTTVATPVINGRLSGLPDSAVAGNYYLRAYIDHNLNGTRDIWESWGYANYYGIHDKPYDPRPIVAKPFAVQPEIADIIIEDCDTDQDWFPDAWEFETAGGVLDFLAQVGPATGSYHDTEINPELNATGFHGTAMYSVLSLGTSDYDGDGLDDFQEMLLGSNASNPSTAGDGYLDGDKAALGISPAASLNLNLRGINLADGLPQVDWKVAVESSGIGTQSMNAAPEVEYELLYTESLSDPQWRVVGGGSVTLDGVQHLTTEVQDVTELDPQAGFFRIRLK